MRLRLWPDTLFWRLVVVLAAGMFAGQVLTGSIWFESYENRTLEIPARLFASRLADTVRLVQRAPEASARDAVTAQLADDRYRLRWLPAEPAPSHWADAGNELARHATQELMGGVIGKRLGEPVDVRLLDATFHGEDGRKLSGLGLFDSRAPTAVFHVQLKVPGQGWLDVQSSEGQAGLHEESTGRVLNYLVRLYLVRFLAICLLAFVAVRIALAPIRQLTGAARALGRNIHRAPMAVTGPREVRDVTLAFNDMQRQLVDGFSARSRMLSAISHDLRSPLTRLRLRVEMLPEPAWRDRLRGDLDEMEAMVRATLDATQGIEITEPLQRIDLDSMLQGIAADLEEAGHEVSVSGRTTAPIAGYARNLKRGLQNLLDNAIRYGDAAAVTVHDDGRDVVVTVRDRGPGIADDVLRERVFEPYFRIKAAGAEVSPGTGLGLAIVRSIAAAHGGSVTLRNVHDDARIVGLEAVLTLPRG